MPNEICNAYSSLFYPYYEYRLYGCLGSKSGALNIPIAATNIARRHYWLWQELSWTWCFENRNAGDAADKSGQVING